jgi:hypothetical protein
MPDNFGYFSLLAVLALLMSSGLSVDALLQEGDKMKGSALMVSAKLVRQICCNANKMI